MTKGNLARLLFLSMRNEQGVAEKRCKALFLRNSRAFGECAYLIFIQNERSAIVHLLVSRVIEFKAWQTPLVSGQFYTFVDLVDCDISFVHGGFDYFRVCDLEKYCVENFELVQGRV